MSAKRKKLNMDSAVLWYMVGVITTDGCLSLDGRHIDITAKSREYLENLKNAAGIPNKVGTKNIGKNNQAYHLQISNIEFYEFLLSLGLSPRKSLIQKKVKVPEEYFSDFCRGVIDGDGSIRKWAHPTNQCEQWGLRIYSASREFVEWLKGTIERLFDAKGRIYREEKFQRNDAFILKYGKMSAIKILRKCYYENALALDRKFQLAQECCSSKIGWGRV